MNVNVDISMISERLKKQMFLRITDIGCSSFFEDPKSQTALWKIMQIQLLIWLFQHSVTPHMVLHVFEVNVTSQKKTQCCLFIFHICLLERLYHLPGILQLELWFAVCLWIIQGSTTVQCSTSTGPALIRSTGLRINICPFNPEGDQDQRF